MTIQIKSLFGKRSPYSLHTVPICCLASAVFEVFAFNYMKIIYGQVKALRNGDDLAVRFFMPIVLELSKAVLT